MNEIVLFGAGSQICEDVVESCRRNGRPIAAAIRNVPGDVYAGDGVRVLDVAEVNAEIAALPFLLPMFEPRNRRTALAAAEACNFHTPALLVDCTSIVNSTCRIEPGVYVNAGCIIGSRTVLEPFVFCNRGVNIGHHCRIGAFASIGPGAVLAGQVRVGEDCLIGAGAIVMPKVTLGAGALVAPGAVISRDVPANGFAAGNPARILARRPVGP